MKLINVTELMPPRISNKGQHRRLGVQIEWISLPYLKSRVTRASMGLWALERRNSWCCLAKC